MLQCEVQLGMEHAKRSRAKRHGAREGGQFFLSSAFGEGAKGGGRVWWLGLGSGLEALQGRAGEHLDFVDVPFSPIPLSVAL